MGRVAAVVSSDLGRGSLIAAIGQAANDRVLPQDTSAIDQLVKKMSRPPDDKRARRVKKDSGDPAD